MVDPRYLSVLAWINRTNLLLAPYGPVRRVTDPKGWKDWARYVVALPAVAAVNAPRPEGFEDWRSWAVAFNLSAQALIS